MVLEYSLKTEYPQVAKQWNIERNNPLKPENIMPVSGKNVWWKCENGHEWQAVIANRTKIGNGCPFCSGRKAIKGENDFASLFPQIANDWDDKKNLEMACEYRPGSHYKAWWKCKRGHEWQSTITHRTRRGDGCPYCSGRYSVKGETDLKTLYPDIASKWNYEKNEKGPEEYSAKSHYRVWWSCSYNHLFQCKISDMVTKNIDCPYCYGRYPIIGKTDLETVYPMIAAEWHQTKNRGLLPSSVTSKSNKKVWWKCENGHEWKAVIGNRAKGKGCPYCGGRNSKNHVSI